MAIESHPHPLTTLGKLLLMESETMPLKRVASFNEAFNMLSKAIEIEQRKSRLRAIPFFTLFAGVVKYVDNGGKLTGDKSGR